MSRQRKSWNRYLDGESTRSAAASLEHKDWLMVVGRAALLRGQGGAATPPYRSLGAQGTPMNHEPVASRLHTLPLV